MDPSPASGAGDARSPTTPPAPRPAAGFLRRWPSWTLVAGSLLVSVAICVLALTTASGVTDPGGSSYDTEFVSSLWSLAWALPLLPTLTACSRPRAAPWVGAAVVLPQLVTAGIVVHLSRAGGRGDGLEMFSFAMPVALVLIIAALLGLVALGRHATLHT